MWHRYWQNLFFNKIILWIGIYLLSTAYAQETPLNAEKFNTNYPGVYKSFQDLIDIDQAKIKNKMNQLQKKFVDFADVSDLKQIELDPDFLNSILLRSSGSYMELASKDKCSFYDLILTDLVQDADGKITKLFIQYPDKENNLKQGVVLKKDFIEKVITPQCPDRKQIIADFQIKTIDKTLKNTPMEIPQNKGQCDAIYNQWYNNPRMIYYCQIYEVIKEGENVELERQFFLSQGMKQGDIQQKIAFAGMLRKKLQQNQWDLLQAFCPNVDKPQRFCDSFFQTSFWNKILTGQKSNFHIEKRCQALLNKESLSPIAIKECVRQLSQGPASCHYFNTKMPTLAPMPDCDSLSLALNNSSLNADYDDCAGLGGSQAMFNTSRIVRNFTPMNIPKIDGQCSALASGTMYEFLTKNDSEELWNIQLCFDDKILNKEVCKPVIFGDYGDNKFSLTTVVRDILIKIKGADKQVKCSIVSENEYNPNLLEFKSGCFIEIDQKKCTQSSCHPKIFYNERPITNIKVKDRLLTDYFATTLQREKISMQYLFTRDGIRKTRIVHNLTVLKSIFAENIKTIIHGIGCIEDLYPSMFKKMAFNQCTPIPFIIDGIINEGERTALIIRTGADDIHAPRLISWSNIYSAVKAYEQAQPLKQWILYAIY